MMLALATVVGDAVVGAAVVFLFASAHETRTNKNTARTIDFVDKAIFNNCCRGSYASRTIVSTAGLYLLGLEPKFVEHVSP